ncbi:Lcl domain-containing protein [Roseateles sp. NT4]|uniref:Lcl domain-containing protein n=1 Tax=Roseateles sp. NT4 TaxID=3453715 RepID=UPI003EEA7808
MKPARRPTPAPAKPRRAWLLTALLIAAVAFAIFGGLRKVQSWFLGTSDPSRYVLLEFPSGMVLDRKTQLVWHRCPKGTELDQDGVGPLCKGNADWVDVELAGSVEKHFSQYGEPWRLPSVDELKGLSIAPDRCCYSLDPIAFPVIEEQPERIVGEGYAFHTAAIDKALRVSTRVDMSNGRTREEPLRQEAYLRLVRKATREELSSWSSTKAIDRSQFNSSNVSLKPRAHPRSNWFVEGRSDAIGNGWLNGRECSDITDNQRQRGCRDGVQANVNARLKQGVEWAKSYKPATTSDCSIPDPYAVQGCQQYVYRYVSDKP